jgi:outer membrane protein assembly factor BamA
MTMTQSGSLNINKEKYDIAVQANVTYTQVQYSVNKSLNEDYLTQTYSGDFAYTFPMDFIVAVNIDYYINSGRAKGYNQTIPMMNAAISKQLFKKKNGELKFMVNDLLNQNQSISRSTSDNYIQDTKSLVLRRYFMISFQYNLNKVGGKKDKDDHQKSPSAGRRALL